MIRVAHTEVIARIFDECASPLGFAMRGVASWEYDQLLAWRDLPRLTTHEAAQLEAIARHVFGPGNRVAKRNHQVYEMEMNWQRYDGHTSFERE